MKIVEMFLNSQNGFPVDGTAIGQMIQNCNKTELWEERTCGSVNVIVVHYISACMTNPSDPYDTGSILKIFCDYGVSSHFLIDRSGTVLQLVPVDKKAWHCGGSIMPDGRKYVNDFSIGIELMATAESGFTAEQYRSLIDLSLLMEKKFGIVFTYVGHEDIAGQCAVELGLRKDAKVDPGGLFDWSYFRTSLNAVRLCKSC